MDTCNVAHMQCLHTRMPNCCVVDEDCADGIVCTLNSCENHVCVATPVLDCDPSTRPSDGGAATGAGDRDAASPSDAAAVDACVATPSSSCGQDAGTTGPPQPAQRDGGSAGTPTMDSNALFGQARAGSRAAADGPFDSDSEPHVRGGACTVTAAGRHESARWMLMFVLVIGLRARRRCWPAIVLLVACAAVVPARAAADGFRADRYHAPVRSEDLFWLERAAPVASHLAVDGRITLGFADDPIVVSPDRHRAATTALVGEQLGFYASVGLTLFEHLHVALAAPAWLQAGSGPALSSAGGDFGLTRAAFGDPALDLRLVILDRSAVLELALATNVRAPIGTAGAFAGDRGFSTTPRLLLSRVIGTNGFVGAMVGFALRPEARLGDLTVNDEFVWTAGALLAASERIGVTLEAAGSTVVARALDAQHTPLEATVGVRYTHPSGVTFASGLGAGLTSGYGAPDARVLLSIAARTAPL
jgi:hypothetical protein